MSNWKGYKIIINKFGNWQLAIWQNWSFGQLYHSRSEGLKIAQLLAILTTTPLLMCTWFSKSLVYLIFELDFWTWSFFFVTGIFAGYTQTQAAKIKFKHQIQKSISWARYFKNPVQINKGTGFSPPRFWYSGAPAKVFVVGHFYIMSRKRSKKIDLLFDIQLFAARKAKWSSNGNIFSYQLLST